ncbi:MAG: c-type cytochrome [Thiogranum sp.]
MNGMIGALVVPAMVAMASFVLPLSVNAEDEVDPQAQVEENIMPVGQVNVGSVPAAAGEAAPAAPAAEAPAAEAPAAAEPAGAAAGRSGEEVFNAHCVACHGTGVAGAPKVGDSAAWAPRAAQGIDPLLQHATNGLNAMPPKGTCMACSDAELKGAIEYMLSKSGQ